MAVVRALKNSKKKTVAAKKTASKKPAKKSSASNSAKKKALAKKGTGPRRFPTKAELEAMKAAQAGTPCCATES